MSDGTPPALPFMVPTQDEVDAMLASGGKVSSLMAWAEVDAELGAHFLTKELGVGADDHWGVMAGFSIVVYDEVQRGVIAPWGQGEVAQCLQGGQIPFRSCG